MNVNFVEINWPKTTDPLCIIPIEVHWSRRTRSNGFCRTTWLNFLKRVEKDPKCRVILVGDIIDSDRPSTRERRMIMGLGRPEVLEEDDFNHMDEMKAHLIPDLKRIKDKIIGAVDGDHYKVYANGMTSTKFILKELGIEKAYLGERSGWIRIVISNFNSRVSYDIFVRHGKGAASTFGTDMNALVRQSVGFDADLYVGGHTHRQWFVKVPHLYCGKYDIRQRFVGYARSGSLLRGFLYGQSTYAEAAEYQPLSIGWPEIYVRFGKTNQDMSLRVMDIKGLT